MKPNQGQVLVGVIVIMLIMAITIPAMVLYVQNEAKWSQKQQENMTAFQLAEAAVDRGFRKISESTTTWANGQLAVFPDGYKFDRSYDDLAGGYYTVSISSGPNKQQVTIIGIAKQDRNQEVRSIQAVFANAPLGDTAVRSASGINISGPVVHWGAIVSGTSITGYSQAYPQLWSAGAISNFDTVMGPADTDSIQWHSFVTTLPPEPSFDPAAYKIQANTDGTYYGGTRCWGKNAGTGANCGAAACSLTCSNATDCDTGKTYFIEGDLCADGKIFVKGTLYITGNLWTANGQCGEGKPTVSFPQKAWMQYGNSWATYTGANWDSTEPAAWPTFSSSYLSPAADTVAFTKVIVRGFLYVGGTLAEQGGGGDCKVLGGAYVRGGTSFIGNNFSIYYLEEVGDYMRTTTVSLTRISWKDLTRPWPTGL